MVIATAAAIAALAGVARAQPVQCSGPAECPAQAEVIGEIERQLGGEVDWSKHAALGAVVEASPDAGGWRVVMTTRQPEGFRELRGATCKEVAEAAALVIAMIIDPEALLATTTDPTPVEPGADDEVPGSPDTTTATAATAATTGGATTPVRWGLRGNIVSDIGALPGVKPGVGLTAAATLGRWRVEVAGTYWFQRREPLADDPDIGGDLSMWTGAVRGCYGVRGWLGCGGFEAGQVAGSGYGIQDPISNTSTWMAPTLSVARELKLSQWLSFFVSAEAALALRRPHFNVTVEVEDMDVVAEVHQPAPVVGRVLVGAEVGIP